MAILTSAEIDGELASRAKEVGAISQTMVALDSHPGLQHVRRYPPTGVTAQQWEVVEKSLAQLWADLGWMTSILESAQAVRKRKSRLDDHDRAELTRLLRQRCLALPDERIPWAQRSINGTTNIGLADTVDRMRAAYSSAVEFLDTVDEINTLAAKGCAPVLKRLDATGAAAPKELLDLLEVTATDPLSLSAHQVNERITSIARSVEQRSAELAELAALQANWPEALATTESRLAALHEATQRAEQIRAHTRRSVLAGPFPVHIDNEPALRDELRSITAPDPPALQALRRRIDTAVQRARESEELAQGLLDRRTELRGRLRAYQAKAARLGLGEDPDLLSSSRIAVGLLSRTPCDLGMVTRAIADYQQMIAEKRGKTR
jgi:hypothetical protein